MNDYLGTVVANAAIVPAGNDASGSVDAFVVNPTDLVIDINGYYAPQSGITLAPGSVGAPSLSFTGEADTGIYSSGAGTVNIATGGTNSVTVNSNGNVGIGTSSPAATLEVNGNAQVDGGNILAKGSVPVIQFPVSGSENFGAGLGALPQSITGTGDTALGDYALQVNTSGSFNTAVGNGALTSNTTGSSNTASGNGALFANTAGSSNTASGYGALVDNTSGSANTAGGYDALSNNTTGNYNTATGNSAMFGNTTGLNNTGLGADTLYANISGNNNIAVGYQAGYNVLASNNIQIGNQGTGADSGTIRIGTPGTQTTAFIAGISTSNVTGATVQVSPGGQLGIAVSSRRYKEDIHDMGETSSGLMRLRPVTFRYKKAFDDGSQPVQYGLIAEEVAEVYPDLVARSADGQIETVKYQLLDPMLLNELQKQNATITAQKEQIRTLEERLARIEAALSGATVTAASR
ncbi:MAG TPA: tail fiber domain-containing protein [Bryobacteraceae bacterium]|nr:tail fiber domain-containing protein [Bryobacteraceae bacterium]